MKKIFSLCIMVCAFVFVSAQVVIIKDIETEIPVRNVQLKLVQNNNGQTLENGVSDYTGAAGQVDISIFKGGVVEISCTGYETVQVSYEKLSADSIYYIVPDALKIGTTVISNTRWAQNSRDVPSRISVISSKDVELQNPQTAADLLSLKGDVFIQKSQQGGGSPMIRGFATNRLVYTVDGVRMNNAIFRGGNIQNVISLDPFAIKNTEVLFGPGSVIYGSDAIGGTMSFTTLTPLLNISNSYVTGSAVTRTASANNEQTGHFDVMLGNSRWAMVTSFTSTSYGDLRMGTNGPDDYLSPVYVQRLNGADVAVTNSDPLVQTPSGYSQINMMQKIRFVPNQRWDFQYGFHYSETSSYSRYDRHQRMRNGLPRYGEWYYGPQKWMMNNLSATYKKHTSMYDKITLRLAQQQFEESRVSRNFNDSIREIREELVDAYSVNLDFIKHFSDDHIITYGVELVRNDVTSTGTNENILSNEKMLGASRYPQAEWASYAAYVSYENKIAKHVVMQTGLRYNGFSLNADFDTSFYPFPFTEANMTNASTTGSIGFIYQPEGNWIISTNFSTAFRAPNVDDAGKVFDSEPGAVVIPNPNLEAEYAYNADIDIAKIFGNSVKLDMSAFYTRLNNALVRRNFTLNGQDSIMYDGELSQVQAIQNAAYTTVYGLQAGIDIKFTKGLEFSSNFNYQIGEEELDDGTTSPSRHAPPWFGKSSLSYKFGNLRMQLYSMYSGERKFEDMPESEKGKTEIYALDNDGNPHSPNWYTLNFKANYKLNNNFSLGAGLENITDKRYRPYSSGISAPGRNFILSLKANF